VLIVTKQYREAESVCKTAIELSPRSVDARVNFASLLAATRRPEQAEAEFRNAITIDQEHAIAHNGLGLLLKSMNRFEEAEVEFRKAIAINPNYMTAYFNFGQLLREGGRLEEAERAFRNAILANRKDARAYCELGLVLAQQMKRDRAAAMYRKAIFLDPDLSAAYCNLGVLLVQSTDRFSEAIELFEHARQSQNPVWSARATRFKALAKQLQVMDETLAAVRAGKILPRNSVQVVALADFALTQKRQPWIAAKLFLTGFGDSALTPRIRSRYRYNAARAVLLVAAGRVEMGAKMPIPEEAARQRALGLSFLRTDLELWNKVMAGNDRARRAAVRRLQHWRVDPDLEIVRDASINKLSPHEQVAWRQFWSDVLEVVQSQPVAALRP
jgi:tetratricopeptide (TPR) repeat protein